MTGEHDLQRFVDAQEPIYPRALEEIRRGAKRTHWMWFIFPQLKRLGRSAMAQRYAIASVDEAKAYLDHPVLGPRYLECVTALQDLTGTTAVAVFGDTDARKLCSSLTLFEAAGEAPLIAAALDRWFGGNRDKRSRALLASPAP